MYVRDAKNREEVWLLDHIEEMGLDDTAFRSRDYVVAIDEETNAKAGFGRIRIHTTDDGEVCELTSIGVLEEWRGQGVGAHVVERLVEYTGDADFETVYSLTSGSEYLAQFGFRRIDEGALPAVLAERLEEKREATDPDAVALALAVERFRVPEELRESFKAASEGRGGDGGGEAETPEDFGIDPATATYKYDTGR
ncbi:GNAT family N-acetyltransferase [Natronobiforma cellulositropha]|uniref:GNAT family N-acetyltransferase n=1 Tax=Natronobiforma cellulositropha TaxID=1679076 RepID=UPI0021D574F5|nr:GNAT family N-acetyltransferase [Natronobiforma cellulositropha]